MRKQFISNMETILLAAGLSRRMGYQKLLLPFGNSTVIGEVITKLKRADYGLIHCVTSSATAKFIADSSFGIDIQINQYPECGKSSSMNIGLHSLTKDCRTFAVMLGDLPMITENTLSNLKEKYLKKEKGYTLLAPWRGAFGHPMIFDICWKNRFVSAQGDDGERAVVKSFPEEIKRVSAPDCCFKDLDTPEEYEKYTI